MLATRANLTYGTPNNANRSNRYLAPTCGRTDIRGMSPSRRGRPSRGDVLRALDRAVEDLRSVGGLPRPVEADAIWEGIWYEEAHHSTAIEGNTLVLREVEQTAFPSRRSPLARRARILPAARHPSFQRRHDAAPLFRRACAVNGLAARCQPGPPERRESDAVRRRAAHTLRTDPPVPRRERPGRSIGDKPPARPPRVPAGRHLQARSHAVSQRSSAGRSRRRRSSGRDARPSRHRRHLPLPSPRARRAAPTRSTPIVVRPRALWERSLRRGETGTATGYSAHRPVVLQQAVGAGIQGASLQTRTSLTCSSA
jgi:hypothetical protein